MVFVDDVKGFDGVEWDVQAMRQSIARAAWDDGQGHVGSYERRSHFVDGTIATGDGENVNMLVDCIFRENTGMAWILRDEDLMVESRVVKMLLNLLRKMVFVLLAGDGVNDESYLQLAHGSRQLWVSNCWKSSCCCTLEGNGTTCRTHRDIAAGRRDCCSGASR